MEYALKSHTDDTDAMIPIAFRELISTEELCLCPVSCIAVLRILLSADRVPRLQVFPEAFAETTKKD